jgi:hypothetical protein
VVLNEDLKYHSRTHRAISCDQPPIAITMLVPCWSTINVGNVLESPLPQRQLIQAHQECREFGAFSPTSSTLNYSQLGHSPQYSQVAVIGKSGCSISLESCHRIEKSDYLASHSVSLPWTCPDKANLQSPSPHGQAIEYFFLTTKQHHQKA